MLCIKKSAYLFIFALFAVLFGSCIITSKNVSAVSDFTFTFDSSMSDPSERFFCGSPSPRVCSDYRYLIVSRSGSSGSSISFNIGNGSFYVQVDPFYYLFEFSSSISSIVFPKSFSSLGSDTITVTLTDTLPSNSCPVCPDIPDNPYDPKFDEIKQAILIIPATALVIYFFFCIYRMLLKGRE